MSQFAIIGGTGLMKLEGLVVKKELCVATAFGAPSSNLLIGEVFGVEVVFLARHGNPHTIPPHKINYRANIAALADIGVTKVIAVNAVGGIRSDMTPARVCIPDEIIDYTWGREATFFSDNLEQVTHIDFTYPFNEPLRQTLIAAASDLAIDTSQSGVYACTQGPRLETAAEITRLEKDGCDIVGMTGMPEAVLAAEKGLAYASVALVVNWAAGKTKDIITMEEIDRAIDAGMGKVRSIIEQALHLMARVP